MMGNGGANFWYQLKDESVNTNGDPALDENGSLIPNYLTSDNPNKANYNSKRIAGDDGADGQWYWFCCCSGTLFVAYQSSIYQFSLVYQACLPYRPDSRCDSSALPHLL